jgi:hypothetical protein
VEATPPTATTRARQAVVISPFYTLPAVSQPLLAKSCAGPATARSSNTMQQVGCRTSGKRLCTICGRCIAQELSVATRAPRCEKNAALEHKSVCELRSRNRDPTRKRRHECVGIGTLHQRRPLPGPRLHCAWAPRRKHS